MHKAFKIAADIEIRKNGTLFLDRKRIELLRRIRLSGSILAASKEMKMSYQMAWIYIKEMNAVSPLPIVTMQRGGTNGGGAGLTEYGLSLVGKFLLVEQKHKDYLSVLEEDMDICFSKSR
ncbi:MAG: LysR family transcriptional regulator [Dysgonamonadaceae bacterium]|jgi:molybdate transport system regulatory protein|nr:LysR family transcriptional regulator [Dysgonamonadaceae bacterium]